MIENEIKKRDEELVKKDVEIAQIKEEMKKKLERNQQTLKRIIIQKENKRNRIINEIDRKTKQHERLVQDYKDLEYEFHSLRKRLRYMEDIKAEEDEKRRKKQAVLERYEEVKEEAKSAEFKN